MRQPGAGHLQRRRRRPAAVERGRRRSAASARGRCRPSAPGWPPASLDTSRICELPPELLDLLRYGRGVDNRRLKRAGFTYRYTSAGAVENFAEASRLRRTVGDSRPVVQVRARRRGVLPALPRRRPATRRPVALVRASTSTTASPSSPSTTPSGATCSSLPMVDEIVAAFDAARGRRRPWARSSSPARRRRSAPAPTWATWARRRRAATAAASRPSTRASSASPRRTLPDHRRRQRRRRRRGHEPGAGVRRAGGRTVGPLRHPLPAARPAPRRRPHLDAANGPSGPQTAAAMVLFGEVLDGEAAAELRPGVALRRRRRAARRGDGPGRRRPRRAAARSRADQADPGHRRRARRPRRRRRGRARGPALVVQQPFFAERLAAIRDRVGKKN